MSGTERLSARTRVVAVLGWPVEHSLSPAIHNAALEALGLDWVYVAFPVRPADLGQAMRGLEALGSGGANLTMPLKELAPAHCGALAPEAEMLGAVNTLVPDGRGRFVGHNTDAPGFRRFLEGAGFDAAGRTVAILGSGGAARACALALGRMGAGRVLVVARSPDRAEPVVGLARECGATEAGFLRWNADLSEVSGSDLVVNATPLGMRGERLPEDACRLGSGQMAVDLIYSPAQTPFLAEARSHGAVTHNGLGLLLAQAGLSLELWTGSTPSLEVMSAAALRALAAQAHEREGRIP
ncbi:MAG: shikimate dehydrogenase [Actinomycetota bacterium]